MGKGFREEVYTSCDKSEKNQKLCRENNVEKVPHNIFYDSKTGEKNVELGVHSMKEILNKTNCGININLFELLN